MHLRVDYRDFDVVVVGEGVVGLTTADALLDRNLRVLVVGLGPNKPVSLDARRITPETTFLSTASSAAGAFWMPFLLDGCTAEELVCNSAWALTTFLRWQQLMQHPSFASSIAMGECVRLDCTALQLREEWLTDELEKALPQLRAVREADGAVSFETLIMDSPRVLAQLKEVVASKGASFVCAEAGMNRAELQAAMKQSSQTIFVNCSGCNGDFLNSPGAVGARPVRRNRGDLLHFDHKFTPGTPFGRPMVVVNESDPQHIAYAIVHHERVSLGGSSVDESSSDFAHSESSHKQMRLHILTNCRTRLGEAYALEIEKLARRDGYGWNAATQSFVPAAVNESASETSPSLHTFGYRPLRRGGPLVDWERNLVPSTPYARLLHNYGHGGSGWTIAWGTAEAVCQKVAQVRSTALPAASARPRGRFRARGN